MKVEDITENNIALGQEVNFVPVSWQIELSTQDEKGKQRPRKRVTGKIIYINRRHRHYTVEVTTPAGTYREGFKF